MQPAATRPSNMQPLPKAFEAADPPHRPMFTSGRKGIPRADTAESPYVHRRTVGADSQPPQSAWREVEPAATLPSSPAGSPFVHRFIVGAASQPSQSAQREAVTVIEIDPGQYSTIIEIKDLPDDSPLEAIDAQNKMVDAITTHDPANPTEEQVEKLLRALVDYNKVAVRLYQDSSARAGLANVAADMLSNLGTNLLPVTLSACVGHLVRAGGGDLADARLAQSMTFAAALGVTNTVAEPVMDAARGAFGAHKVSIFLADRNSTINEEYRKMAGSFAQNIVFTAAYSVAHTLIHSQLGTGDAIGCTIGKAMAASTLSGLTTSMIREPSLATGARATLRSNGVQRAEDLPVVAYGGTLKSGVYLERAGSWAHQGTTMQRIKKYVGTSVGFALAAAAQFGIDQWLRSYTQSQVFAPMSHTDSNVSESAPDSAPISEGPNIGVDLGIMFARLATFQAVKVAVELVWAYFVTQPNQTRASALKEYEALLDQFSEGLEQWADSAAEEEALRARRIFGNIETAKTDADTRAFAGLLRTKAEAIRALDSTAPSRFSRMADRLEASADLLVEGSTVQAQDKLRGVQALFEESTISDPNIVPKVNAAMRELLPLLVGLRAADGSRNDATATPERPSTPFEEALELATFAGRSSHRGGESPSESHREGLGAVDDRPKVTLREPATGGERPTPRPGDEPERIETRLGRPGKPTHNQRVSGATVGTLTIPVS